MVQWGRPLTTTTTTNHVHPYASTNMHMYEKERDYKNEWLYAFDIANFYMKMHKSFIVDLKCSSTQ